MQIQRGQLHRAVGYVKHNSPRHRTRYAERAAKHVCNAGELLSIPLFPLTSVLHPTQRGSVRVFEPRYLTLFRNLQEQAQGKPGAMKFGHILAGSAAPPALLQDAVGGLPRLGVCATVKAIQELGDGTLVVDYEGIRRFRLLLVDDDEKCYKVGAAEWYDDSLAGQSPADRQELDQLEQQVFAALTEVARAMDLLQPPPGDEQRPGDEASSSSSSASASLPQSVHVYAPPPKKQKSFAEYLDEAGSPAGQRIATWQRMGSVYGTPAKKKAPAIDPYQAMREHVAKDQRQELFSFAAASVLEMGLPERLALLSTQDTGARLQYVLAAIQPHLQELQARLSVKKAIGRY